MTITELNQVRASAVPAVPKEITAKQRIAALALAQECEDIARAADFLGHPRLQTSLLDNAAKLLRELAK